MWATIIKMWNRYSYVYIQGLTGTLCLAAITVLCGTVLGTLLAIMRRSRIKPFQWFVQFYVWVLRGTPILLQLYFSGSSFPEPPGLKFLTPPASSSPDRQCQLLRIGNHPGRHPGRRYRTDGGSPQPGDDRPEYHD